MAERDTKVLEMVEQELKKDPKVSGAALQEKARSINKEEAELSLRSFNARYPLPVRKKTFREDWWKEEGLRQEVFFAGSQATFRPEEERAYL